MSIDFTAVVASPPSGRDTALVLDHLAYAQRVLLRGNPVPWDDVTGFANLLGQAEGLLRADVRVLDVGALYDALIAGDAALVSAMTARSRVGFALRTLLADENTAQRAVRFTEVVAQTSRLPLVLQVPSPTLWAARTHVLVGGTPDEVTADHGENLAVYVADWLRRFSVVPVALLMLDDRRAATPGLPAVELAAYSPVLNAADHYRWPVGLRTDEGLELAGTQARGVAVPPEYWLETEVAVPAGDFWIAELPADAEPEAVLARLAGLDGGDVRGQGAA
jgi:hypothetical protein